MCCFASPADDSDHAVDLAVLGIEKHRIELNSSTFDAWLTEQSPDIVMFDRFMMEEQFGWRVEKFAPKAIRILDMEDVHCLRDARHRAVKAGRPVTELEWQTDMAFREIASLLRCDLTLVISEYEMTWLQDNFRLIDQRSCTCRLCLVRPIGRSKLSMSVNTSSRSATFVMLRTGMPCCSYVSYGRTSVVSSHLQSFMFTALTRLRKQRSWITRALVSG